MDKNAPSTKQMRKDGAHEHPRDGAGLQQSEPEADSGPSQDALLAAFDLNSDCDDATFFSQLDWNKMIAAMTSFSQEVRRAKGSPDPDPQEVAVELAKMVLEMEAEIGLDLSLGMASTPLVKWCCLAARMLRNIRNKLHRHLHLNFTKHHAHQVLTLTLALQLFRQALQGNAKKLT